MAVPLLPNDFWRKLEAKAQGCLAPNSSESPTVDLPHRIDEFWEQTRYLEEEKSGICCIHGSTSSMLGASGAALPSTPGVQLGVHRSDPKLVARARRNPRRPPS